MIQWGSRQRFDCICAGVLERGEFAKYPTLPMRLKARRCSQFCLMERALVTAMSKNVDPGFMDTTYHEKKRNRIDILPPF